MLVGATDVTLTCTVNVALYFGVKKFTKTVFVDLVRKLKLKIRNFTSEL